MKKIFLFCILFSVFSALASAQDSSQFLLIDDFDDRTSKNEFGGEYYNFDDHESPAGKGNSKIKFSTKKKPGYADEGKCLWVNWQIGLALEYPFAGLYMALINDQNPFRKAADYDGISFMARGEGTLWFRLHTGQIGKDRYNYQPDQIKLGKEWKEYRIMFKDLKQVDWEKQVPFDPAMLNGFNLTGDIGSTVNLELYLDDLKFIKAGYTAAKSQTIADTGNNGMIAQKELAEVFGKSVAVVGLQSDVVSETTSSSLVDFLINALVNVNRVDVIDRQSIDLILNEQKLQLSGITDASTATEIGKIIGVEYVVIANLSKIEDIYYLHVKMINVETATIIGSTMTPASGPADFLNMCNNGIDALFQKL
ncbi:MAG: hypothetical protein JW874_07830 [Spirochaetales bacterium]|nr:hypothetical protein [Spirochaetales bacterium]